MNFIAYGNCFSFAWANTSIGQVIIEPNKTQRVGTARIRLVVARPVDVTRVNVVVVFTSFRWAC
jgi:hypothetical protein